MVKEKVGEAAVTFVFCALTLVIKIKERSIRNFISSLIGAIYEKT